MKKSICIMILFCTLFTSVSLRAQQAEFGLASFYDDSFQGSKTAYGVKYDKNDLTTAHKIHPFGTLLRITRLDNKKSVVVKVIDKGPYMKGRVVDLSKRAAQQLGIIEDGSAEVKVELYQKADKSTAETSTRAVTERTPATTTRTRAATEDIIPDNFENNDRPATNTSRATSSTTRTTAPKTVASKTTTTKTAAAKAPTKPKTTAKGAAPVRLVKQDYTQYGLYKIQLERPVKKGFGVQVASLTNYESVMKQIANLQAKSFDNILVSIEKGATKTQSVYKVILGPHTTEATATGYKNSLKKDTK